MKATVVGLGKIGLPLALQAASKGWQVLGADINPRVVEQINAGREPFPGEPTLRERLAEAVASGALTATIDTAAAVGESSVVIVVVPLVVDTDGAPDFAALDAATAAVAAGLRPGTLVSYETTLPVHTTRRRLGPALARGSGLNLGADFFLCHSPERVSSGRVFADLRRYPKLVGGIDAQSGKMATAFYEAILDFDQRDDLPRLNGVWDLGTAEAAELTKLVETTYRDVNIALANEFARFADRAGLNVFEVIAAANSQPYSHVHRPGISVGGHCIPIYPRLYLSCDPEATLPAAGRAANAKMPGYAVDRLVELLGNPVGARIAVLGAAFRAGVAELAFSGVFPIVAELARRGAVPMVHDPLFTSKQLRAAGLEPYQLGERCDAAVIHTEHHEYAELTPEDLPGIRALVDGRNIIDPLRWEGTPHRVLGRPTSA